MSPPEALGFLGCFFFLIMTAILDGDWEIVRCDFEGGPNKQHNHLRQV